MQVTNISKITESNTPNMFLDLLHLSINALQSFETVGVLLLADIAL